MLWLISFAGALKAGDLWAKAALVGVVLAALAGFVTYQVYQIRADERARVEAGRTQEGITRQTRSDATAETARRMTERARCEVLARQSGMEVQECAR
jgi:hypothetical protein